MDIPALLRQQIMDIVKDIPHGKVMSYGQIGLKLGIKDARIIGWAMHEVGPHDDVPWWRVLNNEGKLTIKDLAGRQRQRELLRAEGVEVREDFSLDIETYRHGTMPGQGKLL